MEAVARSCTAAGIEARTVPLRGLPPKGDVSDWLDAGHSRDELVALCDSVAMDVPPAVKAHTPIRQRARNYEGHGPVQNRCSTRPSRAIKQAATTHRIIFNSLAMRLSSSDDSASTLHWGRKWNGCTSSRRVISRPASVSS